METSATSKLDNSLKLWQSLTPTQKQGLKTGQLLREACQRSLKTFLENMTIDSWPTPRRFGEVSDAWQWTRVLNHLIPMVESVCGLRPDYTGPRGLWVTLPKGHDKSSAVARAATFAINFGKIPIRVSVCAADKEQAGLIRDAMVDEKRLNPWLPKEYEIFNYEARGASGGTLEILSSDAFTSQGLRSHWYIIDEICHHKNRRLWDTIFGGSIKYKGCIVTVATNAGYKHSWQWNLLQTFRQDETWYVWDEPCGIIASWIDKNAVEKKRKGMLASEALRLFDNFWQDGNVAQVFPPELVEKIFATHKHGPLLMPELGD